MRKSIAAAAVAASITVGALGGVVLGTPAVSGAQQAAQGAAGWVQEALAGLVSEGTITEDQADAVATALHEARPERPFGRHGHGPRLALAAVADALGMTADELRTALRAGTTVADLAEDKGVEVQTVIDAIVAAHREKLDEKVAAGDLTQQEADQRLATTAERATAFVNGERPPGGFGGPHRHGRAPGPRPFDGAAGDGPTSTSA